MTFGGWNHLEALRSHLEEPGLDDPNWIQGGTIGPHVVSHVLGLPHSMVTSG